MPSRHWDWTASKGDAMSTRQGTKSWLVRWGLHLVAAVAVAIVLGAFANLHAAEPVPRVSEPAKVAPLNVVVYGGSGNIGSRIVKEAASRGHHVTVVDRTPKPELAPP